MREFTFNSLIIKNIIMLLFLMIIIILKHKYILHLHSPPLYCSFFFLEVNLKTFATFIKSISQKSFLKFENESAS